MTNEEFEEIATVIGRMMQKHQHAYAFAVINDDGAMLSSNMTGEDTSEMLHTVADAKRAEMKLVNLGPRTDA